MDRFISIIISLSISGTLLGLLLIICKSIFKHVVSKSFMYYAWLLVLLRFIIPIGVPTNTIKPIFTSIPLNIIEHNVAQDNNMSTQPYTDGSISNIQKNEISDISSQNKVASEHGTDTIIAFKLWDFIKNNLLAIWLLGVIVYFLYFWIAYHRFVHNVIRTSSIPSDSDKEVFTSIYPDKRLRFVCNKYIKIPMHIGIIRPYIIVPEMIYVDNEMGQELEHILYHEIMHYKKKDLLYKWFVLFVASLHWFNPFMIIVRRNINNACELACDEAVIKNMTSSQRIQYGETLIKLSGNEKMPVGVLATTLSEHKSILKERIINIKKYKARSLGMSVTALSLAILLVGCGSLLGPTFPSPLPDIDPQIAEKQTDDTSGFVPETIEVLVDEPSDLPLSLPKRLKDLQPKPLNKDSVLPPLELPSETVVAFPDIYAWQYSVEPADFDATVELAEDAANRMWDNVTKENLDSTYIKIKSEKTDTEYGPYQERISVSCDNTFDNYTTLYYTGLWELYEETPYHYSDYTEREISELIGIAKDFADNMLGLDQYTTGIPIIQEHYSELIDHGLTDEAVKSETTMITWRYTVDGLPISGDGLTVKLINGNVTYLYLKKHELSRKDVQEPAFILDAEEALYCINYTRSYISSSEDSIFKDCPVILSVSPILSNVFSEDSDIFVPTWEFIIAPKKDNPGYIYAIHVNATTGEIHTNTNEGTYLSPYDY